ncbi:hypothetical protein [Halobacteriovorax sp. YZS-1-1]|uniref:hypothetical protein n=1 Tax=unclassified Halobacteriovorax TaxID=2639665 RepID=UPI00399AA9D3
MACSGSHCTNHGYAWTSQGCGGHRSTCATNRALSFTNANLDPGDRINHAHIKNLRDQIASELAARGSHAFYSTVQPSPFPNKGDEVRTATVSNISSAKDSAVPEIDSIGSTARLRSPADNAPRTPDDNSYSGNVFLQNWHFKSSVQQGDEILGSDMKEIVNQYNNLRRDCICHTDCDCNAVCTCHNNCGCHY